jgi:MtrB/PioB family decaheme-associated outer membrane protein
MTNKIGLILALAMTFGVTSTYAAEIKQEVQIGIYGTDGPNSNGEPAASQMEEYGEVNRGVILEKYQVEADLENYDLEAVAENVNKNDRRIRMEGGNRGKTTWELQYEEMPHLYTNEARSFYQTNGNGVLKIPNTVHAALDGAVVAGKIPNNAARLHTESLPYMSVGVIMKTMGGELKFRPYQDFIVEIDAMRTTKRGTRPQAASFGFNNALEVIAPVDEEVVQGGIGLQLNKKRYQLALDYHFEDFSNKIPTLTWDNPKNVLGTEFYTGNHYSNGDASALGQMAMAPDNKVHSFKFEGGVNLGESTRFGFESGVQRWEALNPMIAYTVNEALNPGSAGAAGHGLTFDASLLSNRPDPNVHGIINVITYMGKLSTRFTDNIRGSLMHESYIMENRSKKLTVQGWAVFDQNWHSEVTSPQREEFRDDKTTAKLEYGITDTISGNTGVSTKYMKKTRAVDKGREYEANTGFTYKPSRKLWVNLGALVSGRRANGWDFQHYPQEEAEGYTWLNESPGLMRPDVADRNRYQGVAQVMWMPGDAMINLSARMTEDRFRAAKGQDLAAGNPFVIPDLFGVLNDRHQSVALDTSFPVSEALDVDLFYEYDFHRQIVRSAQGDSLAAYGVGASGAVRTMLGRADDRWEQRNTEHSNVIGVGLTHRPVPKMKNRVGVDMTFTRSNGDPLVVGSRNVAMLPLETSRRVRKTLKARSEYQLKKDLTLAASYMFEQFQANDFAYTDIGPALADSSIFLGADPIKDYDFHSVGMSVNYKF